MRFLSFTLLFFSISVFCFGQRQGNVWYFGHFAGLDFNSGSPVALTSGQLNTLEGCLSVSDKNTGKILFYSDGDSIWDRNSNVMPNGQGLLGDFSSTQSGIIVPMPGSDTKYYVFTVDAQAGSMPPSYTGFGGLAYSIVDMTLNGGNGDVSLKNQQLITPTCEKVSCIKHCNGVDYWVVTHQYNTDAFYAYLITNAGVQAPVISNPGGVIPQDPFAQYNNGEAIGYLKFSHDGTKLACAHYTGINTVEIFDFNNSTGLVSNPVEDTNFPNISGSDGPYGVTFSPDDSRLYVGYLQYDSVYEPGFFGFGGYWETFGGSNQIYQYNMKAGNAIVASRISIASRMDVAYGALQCAPDGKIYVANESETSADGGFNYLDAINNPNGLGAACNYQQDALFINTGGFNQSLFGLPDIVEAFIIPPHTATLTYQAGCTTNDTITFKDSLTGQVHFLWNFADPTTGTKDTSSLQNATHSFSVPGNYTIKLVVTNPCKSDTFTQTLTINAALSINAGPNVSICANSSTAINVTGGPGGTTYSWAPSTGLSCITCSNPTASPATTTTYIVSAVDNGCSAKDTIIVNVINQIVPTLTPNDTTVCNGNSVQLHAGGGSSYQWSPATGLSSATISNPLATPAATTTYTVSVSAGSCPSVNKTIIITVNPVPVFNPMSNTTICQGSSVTLNATGNNITTYSWSPSTGLSCITCSSPNASPAVTTTYVITAINNICTDKDSVVVNVVSQIAATLTPNDTTICNGNSVQLEAGGGSGYQWLPATGLSSATISNPLATPTVTTTYTVSVSAGSCPSINKTITITVNPTPTINAMQNVTICPGDSATLNATGNNINTYSWLPATGLSCTSCATPVAKPATSTTYTLTANSGSACPATGKVTVSVNSSVIAHAGPADTSICNGNSVQMQSSGGTTYQWSPGAGLSDSTISNPVAVPSITTTYVVTVSGGSCGSDTSSITINVIPVPIIDAMQNANICKGGSAQLNVTGANINTYQWSPGVTLSDSTISNPTATPTLTTTYTITANAGSACAATGTVTVTINTAGSIAAGPDTSLCIGAAVQLKATGGADYQWSPSVGLSNASIPNPVANPTATTTYTVSISGGGCGNSVLFDTVTVNTATLVSAGSDVTIDLGSSTQLNATGQGGLSYLWSPYYFLNAAYVSNPVASPTVTTTFTVYATNKYGCVDSSSVIVNVVILPYIIYPNAFSPNNDGINDYFLPHYYEIQSMDLKVYDRWGEVVFETKNPDDGWDGTFKGKSAPIGVYVYVVQAVTDAGQTLNKKGNVSLLR